MNDPIDIINDTTGGRATVQRSALPALARAGWRPQEPSDVIGDTLTVADVLASVGDDPNKAHAAISAERAGKARKTLLAQLETIARSDQTGDAGDPEEQ